MLKKIHAAVLLCLLLLACLVTGCASKEAPAAKGDALTQTQQDSGPKAPSNTGKTVTINGRSVAENWMKHWGFTWEGPVEQHGYLLDYKELDGNDIAPSFAKNVSGLKPGSVAFFKFCFVDFDGTNLAEREKQVDQVIATAGDKQLKLIIGNALPVRKQDGNPEMLQEYKRYDEFLLQKAASNPNVWVYDFYGALAGPDGFLKPEYQTEDSHPNDRAYTVLDQSFFPLLDLVFAGKQGSSSQVKAHALIRHPSYVASERRLLHVRGPE